jgi:HK97 family phage major capsid protein
MSAAASALDRATILNQAYRILQQTNFSKEDSSRAESLLALANSIDGAEDRFRVLRNNAVARELGLPRDSKLLRFLRGNTPNDRGIATYHEEQRAMDTSTGAVNFGTPLGAPLFRNQVIEAMKQYDQLYDMATWVPTASGQKYSMPSDDDTATSASR